MRRLLSLLAAAMLGAPAALACGAESDCVVMGSSGERTYRLYLPAGHDGVTPLGAIVHAHGYRGSAKGAMGNMSLRALADDLGVALIAGKSAGPDWVIPGVPSPSRIEGADELAYFDAVIADAALRVPLDRDRLMATGFSAGGMMVWNLICHRSELFAGFAPIAGTFWKPEPRTCSTPPATVIHIHGTTDRIVPLSGRPIGDTAQGDVLAVLAMYRAHGGFRGEGRRAVGDLDCLVEKNAAGAFLEFCLFEGGHSFRTAFIRQAWERLEALGKL
ncbi:MAG: polyhydroxybutyrate depolymerase [Pseudomonadota bacterium]